MTVHGLGGLARALLATLLVVSLSGCPDDDSNNNNDMAVSPDMAASGDMAVSNDLTMAEPATAQIVFADITGTIYVPAGGGDGGVPYPYPAHVAAALASFPSKDGSQGHSGTTLHDCNWNRYDLTNADTADNPIPDEPAGTVTITGYHTASMRALTALGTPAAAAPDSTIVCAHGGNSLPYFGCVFSPSMVPADALAFPEFPAAGVMGFMPTGTELSEAFAANPQSTYKDNIPATALKSSPDWLLPRVTSINADTSKTTLDKLEGMFNGSADITIAYDCNGACPTSAGGLTGLLIETHMGEKWESSSGTTGGIPNRAQFGTLQCVDADFPGTPSRNFLLTAQMQKDILGIGKTGTISTSQTIRVVLVRLKAAQTFTGEHPVYLTAGKGSFALIEQK